MNHCFVQPPQINRHPDDRLNVASGSSVEFTVTATGDGDLAYRWQRNAADLDPPPEGVTGETTNTLHIDNVEKKHEGTYKCMVSNAAGSTPSNCAQLTVCKLLYLVFIIQQHTV